MGQAQRSLDSCFRRNDTCWIPACAGMTRGGRRKGAWVPVCAGMTWGRFSAKRTDTGCRRDVCGTGEVCGTGGPLTRRYLRHRRPLPQRGEAVMQTGRLRYVGGLRYRRPLHPAVPSVPPASPARGEAVMQMGRLRYGGPRSRPAGLSHHGRRQPDLTAGPSKGIFLPLK